MSISSNKPLDILNASRLAERGVTLTPQEEIQINRGEISAELAKKLGVDPDLIDGPMMTRSQLERAFGIHANFVPGGASDLLATAEMQFVDRDGQPVTYDQVCDNMSTFLNTAAAMADVVYAGDIPADVNPVEAAIAYARNAAGLAPEMSIEALKTDLVKVSVLGFQVGTERDRTTMAKLNELVGELGDGLVKNRDIRKDTAVFEMGLRHLPEGLPFTVVAGVREAIDYVYNQMDFNEEVIQFLKDEIPATKGWTDEQWNFLRDFKSEVQKLKITGLPDGSIYTGGPLLKVEGPPIVCEFIETAIMSIITPMTQKATALALIKEVFKGPFAELGMRRPPSVDSVIGDIEACNVVADVPTSAVLGQYLDGIRAIGTMEHSAILLNGVEAETALFVQWFLMYGKFTAALVDSRTPEEGVKAVIKAQEIINELRPQLEKDPRYAHLTSWTIPAIRLDSGDLRSQAWQFRKMLDDAGMTDTQVMIMDGMNQEKLKDIVYGNEDGAVTPVFSTGAGESLRFPVAAKDDGTRYHWLNNMIYKAARLYHGDETIDMMKLSATPAKATRPTRSSYRIKDSSGKMVADVAGKCKADGSYEPPAVPPGCTAVDRLVTFAENGQVHEMFELSKQDYWAQTRARFAGEEQTLPHDWRERDELRAAGKEWRPPFAETEELLNFVRGEAKRAGRGPEFSEYLDSHGKVWSDKGQVSQS